MEVPSAPVPPEKVFIFLGGLHRSGTSLLFRMLRHHPRISGFRDTGVAEDEGQLLQTVYPPARRFGGPGKFGFDAAAFLDERSALVSRANAEKLYAEWGRYWEPEKPLLLEKSPPNLVRGRFLQALFPNSRFVMLLRHPVAVGLATQKWSRTPIASLIEHWVICHERFADDHRYLRRLFTLKYEQLVADPAHWMARLYAFLDVTPAPYGESVDADVNGKYFARWRAAMAQRSGERLQAFLKRFEPRVNRFGYSLMDLERIEDLPPDYRAPD